MALKPEIETAISDAARRSLVGLSFQPQEFKDPAVFVRVVPHSAGFGGAAVEVVVDITSGDSILDEIRLYCERERFIIVNQEAQPEYLVYFTILPFFTS